MLFVLLTVRGGVTVAVELCVPDELTVALNVWLTFRVELDVRLAVSLRLAVSDAVRGNQAVLVTFRDGLGLPVTLPVLLSDRLAVNVEGILAVEV